MKSYTRLLAFATTVWVATTLGACSNNADTASGGIGGHDAGGVYRVDASHCPPDATETMVDGEPLKVGTVWPQSGPYAALGLPVVAGMKVAFASRNAEGGVDGHELELDAKDDGYDPTKTLPLVTELIQKDKVFATLGQAGTPHIAAVQQLHEQTCTPQVWAGSGAPQFSDPAAHAWTTSGIMAYTTEAQAWADYLERAKAGAKVAYLQIDTDGGEMYAEAFKAAAEEHGLQLVAAEKVAADAATVENQVTNLLAARPDVVILMSIGSSCAKALGSLGAGGFSGMTLAAYTCQGPDTFPVLGAAADGAQYVSVSKQLDDTGDPDIKRFRADLDTYGGGAKANDSTLLGYRLGMLFADTAEAAAELEGGLTRVNLMNAAWNIDTVWFASVAGRARVDGERDPYVLESGLMFAWDAAKGKLVPVGDVIDREGKTRS